MVALMMERYAVRNATRLPFAGAGEFTGAIWLLGATSLAIGEGALSGHF
jgi:hypothetical protein